LLAPAHAPKEVIARLHREVVAALEAPDVRRRLAAQGYDAGGMPPERFAALIHGDLARWREVIQKAGIKAE
jgi:tripartite-type tricarboxylate transporter receptor subunit TctC